MESCFGLDRPPQHGIAIGQTTYFLPDGYVMLMRPNKAETAVHGCHCPGDMAVRCVRYWPDRGLVFDCVSCRLSHKLLDNLSATFEIFGNFLEFQQLLEFSTTLGFLRFFEATFFTF